MTRLAIASTIYERYQQQREILGRANEPFGAAWNLAAECCLDAARTCGADHMVLEPLVPAVRTTHSFKLWARDV